MWKVYMVSSKARHAMSIRRDQGGEAADMDGEWFDAIKRPFARFFSSKEYVNNKLAGRKALDLALVEWTSFQNIFLPRVLKKLSERLLKYGGVQLKTFTLEDQAHARAILFTRLVPNGYDCVKDMSSNELRLLFTERYIKLAVERGLKCDVGEAEAIEVLHFHLDQGFLGTHTYFESLDKKEPELPPCKVDGLQENEFWEHIARRSTPLDSWLPRIVTLIDLFLRKIDAKIIQFVKDNEECNAFKQAKKYWRDKFSMLLRLKYVVRPVITILFKNRPEYKEMFKSVKKLRFFAYGMMRWTYVDVWRKQWFTIYPQIKGVRLYYDCLKLHKELHANMRVLLWLNTKQDRDVAELFGSKDEIIQIQQTTRPEFEKRVQEKSFAILQDITEPPDVDNIAGK